MIARLLDLLFGCNHPHTSFPLTTRVRGRRQSTAVVCTDCGAAWEYNWATMRRGKRIEVVAVPGLVEKARAIEHRTAMQLGPWGELT